MKRIRSEVIALEKLQQWEVAETLLPEYTEQQYQDLDEFLANGGQLAPVVIAEDYRLIDGYNRWRTAKRLGLNQIECDVYSYEDISEMEMHAIVLNSKRRHLNRLQVARAAARLANLLSPPEPGEEEVPEMEPEKKPPEQQEFNQAEPEVVEEKLQEVAEEEKNEAPAPLADIVYSDQVVREASQKLGVSHSTVKQVSKVDKSGDEMLISAMEDKVITIKQAAEIADLEEEQRRKALEQIDEENKKKNNYVGVFSRTCTDCLRKLQRSRKKFKNAEFTETECHEMKDAIDKVIGEANAMMLLLNNELTIRNEAEEAEEEHKEQMTEAAPE